MQKFEAIGNLTRDLELKTVTVNGKETKVTTLPLAVNNGGREDTLFVDIDVWGKDAENACKYLKKGSQIYVVASLKNKNYEKDGVKCYTFTFTADSVEYLSTPKND